MPAKQNGYFDLDFKGNDIVDRLGLVGRLAAGVTGRTVESTLGGSARLRIERERPSFAAKHSKFRPKVLVPAEGFAGNPIAHKKVAANAGAQSGA